MSRGRNDQRMPSENLADNFIENWEDEAYKPGNMQNYKAVRQLIEMLVSELFMKW